MHWHAHEYQYTCCVVHAIVSQNNPSYLSTTDLNCNTERIFLGLQTKYDIIGTPNAYISLKADRERQAEGLVVVPK